MASTGSINFGGLSSGLDTASIIESLVKVKTIQTVTPIEEKILLNKARKDAMNPLINTMKTLKSASKEMNALFNPIWAQKTASSSDTDYVTITTLNSSTASVGSTVISDISQLAQPDRYIYEGVVDKDSTLLGAGTISITYGGATTDIDISGANSTLEDIAASINNQDIGITATIINDGTATPYRLVLTTDDTGYVDATSNIAVNVTGVGLTQDAVKSALAENEPQNAVYKVNGVTINSASNSVTDVVAGITFNLLKINTTDDITLKVGQNTAAIVAKITNFISSYETLRSNINGAINKDPVTEEYGALAFDSAFSSASVNITNIMGQRFRGLAGNAYASLADIGITRDSAGNILIDTPTLTQAVEQNVEDVKMLFDGSATEAGISERMYSYIDGLVNAANGTLTAKEKNITRSSEYYTKVLKERQALVEQYQDRISKKFATLETTLNRLKTRESAITNFFGIYSQSSNQLL